MDCHSKEDCCVYLFVRKPFDKFVNPSVSCISLQKGKHWIESIIKTDVCFFQMDVEAINLASDNELLIMGLDKKGDILSLRSFVQKLIKESKTEERKSEKMSLRHDILLTGKVKKGVTQQKDGKSLEKMRKVQIGWLHFNDERQSFVSVRTAKGRGTREVDIKLQARKEDVIDIAKTVFFNDGHSMFGSEQSMVFGLANFQRENISIIKVGGVDLPFTLQRYIEKSKMSRVRLYLTSKLKKRDDSSLVKPAEKKPVCTVTAETKDDVAQADENKSQSVKKLEERRKIISEQNVAHEQSLATDKAKRQKLDMQL